MQALSNGVRLTLHVKARSPQTHLDVEEDGTITLRVIAPATGGKANREIAKLFAKKLKISPSQVRLVAGIHSRTKVLEIYGVTEAEVEKAIRSQHF